MTHPALLTPTLAAIHERRSVRSYAPEPVERETISQLLDAAVWAPSAMNTQPWAFVVVQDPALLARIEVDTTELYLQDPPEGDLAGLPEGQLAQLRSLIRSPDFGILHGAPTLVVVYATGPAGIADCSLAGENLMLAAISFGLATCPIGLATPLLDRTDVKAELGVPDGYRCALPIVVGVPAGVTAAPARRPPQVLSWR